MRFPTSSRSLRQDGDIFLVVHSQIDIQLSELALPAVINSLLIIFFLSLSQFKWHILFLNTHGTNTLTGKRAAIIRCIGCNQAIYFYIGEGEEAIEAQST